MWKHLQCSDCHQLYSHRKKLQRNDSGHWRSFCQQACQMLCVFHNRFDTYRIVSHVRNDFCLLQHWKGLQRMHDEKDPTVHLDCISLPEKNILLDYRWVHRVMCLLKCCEIISQHSEYGTSSVQIVCVLPNFCSRIPRAFARRHIRIGTGVDRCCLPRNRRLEDGFEVRVLMWLGKLEMVLD